MDESTSRGPELEAIRETRRWIDPYVLETPIWGWRNRHISEIVGQDTEVLLKLELFQHTGTFKPRGALANMMGLEPDELARGVTAVSAGNHAIAVGYAAAILGTSAKVVMPSYADPARIETCQSYGAQVVLVDDVHQAFDEVHRIEEDEGRAFVHPFENERTVLGTATVGFELCQQVSDLEAVIVPIGGGGLCAGISAAVKQMKPRCQIFGVEPHGADSMTRSFASGQPERIEAVTTIADSLGAPLAMPYTFSLCRRYLDDLVLIDDDDMRRAMLRLYQGTKLAVEPAGAASTAALVGPLRERLRGKRVALIVCGSNVTPETFARHIADIPS
ncbi:MAG: threonine/serine dehydratase [Chloroflexota bacterium]|nr:MAG: threonine/serine dehydratase [Chloroflexota bacterium]